MKLHWIFDRFMRPADDADIGGATGGAVDRGDDFLPTDDDAVDTSATDKDLPKTAKEAADSLRDAADADDDGEGEGEGEEGEDKAKAKDDKDKPKSPKRIPLERHEQILAKERERRQELEQQLQQFQNGREVAAVNADLTKLENNVVELEKKYHAALGDGDVDEAAKLMRQIRTLDGQIADAKADMRAAVAEARAVERVRYSTALERIEEAYPQLNQDHEDFDKDLAQDVIDLKATYEGRGLTPTAALQKAVKRLLDVESRTQEKAVTVAPRVDAEQVAAQRKKEAAKKTADAVGKQPPALTKAGLNSDALGGGLNAKDVIRLSQDEFAKLPDTALAKLRGDEL